MSATTGRWVRAGDLRAFLGSSDVRYVCLGQTELIRRIHVAVRDTAWGTVPLEGAQVRIGHPRSGFSLAFGGRYRGSGIDLDLGCRVTGTADGRIEFAMDGRANSDSAYNRIGICVLLPSDLAGRPITAGSRSEATPGRLPFTVGPQLIEGGRIQALLPPFTELEVDVAKGIGLRLEFTGDEFEIEDQRNWADASFKIYSTPLARGFPFRLGAGERIRQSVVLLAPTGRVQAPLIRAQA